MSISFPRKFELTEEKIKNLDILIFCSGRSGSTTLESSLLNSNFKVFRDHTSSDLLYRTGYKLEDILKLNKNLIIIDSIRDTKSRSISSFLEQKNNFTKSDDLKILKEICNEKIEYLEDYYSYHEIFNIFNLDKNINLIDNDYYFKQIDEYKIIVLNFNKIKKWDEILSKLLKKDIKIIHKNKNHFNYYKEFKDNYILSEKFKNKIKDKNDIHYKELKKIYNKNELEDYINNL